MLEAGLQSETKGHVTQGIMEADMPLEGKTKVCMTMTKVNFTARCWKRTGSHLFEPVQKRTSTHKLSVNNLRAALR